MSVVTGKPKASGGVYYAPVGTALPTDAKTALNDAFKSVGAISEDGVDNADTYEVQEIKDWSGEVVLVVETGHSDEFTFTMIDSTNEDALKMRYGASNVSGTVDGTNGLKVQSNIGALQEISLVFDMALQGNKIKRIVVPSCKISNCDSIKYKGDTAIGYGITVKATADESGNTHYDYTQTKSA